MRYTSILRATTLFSMLAVSAACSVLDPDGYSDERERLEAAREKWRSQNIQDYSLVQRRLCFCGYVNPVTMVVRNNVVISLTDNTTGEPVSTLFRPWYFTVEGLFDFIEDAIDREAHSITVAYDVARGYPVSINIDYIENAIDEEMAYEVSAFQPMR